MAAHGKDADLAGVRTSPPTFSRLMPPYAWVSLLTQYVQIFPETGNVRHELARRVEAFAAQLGRFDTEVLTVFQSELNRKQMGVRLVSIVEAQLHDMRAGMDVIKLLEDLRIHLHNAALHELTGQAIAGSQDSTRERIAPGEDGVLGIVPRPNDA